MIGQRIMFCSLRRGCASAMIAGRSVTPVANLSDIVGG